MANSSPTMSEIQWNFMWGVGTACKSWPETSWSSRRPGGNQPIVGDSILAEKVAFWGRQPLSGFPESPPF